MLWNAFGRSAYSQEHFTTIVYVKFGGLTEWIMGNWKIENGRKGIGVPIMSSQSLLVRNVSAIERKTDYQQSTGSLACVAGVRRGRKEERRAREAREDRTREDRIPSPSSRAHFDFPHFLRPATQATGSWTVWLRYAATQWLRSHFFSLLANSKGREGIDYCVAAYSVLQTWHHKCASQKKHNDTLNPVTMATVWPLVLY